MRGLISGIGPPFFGSLPFRGSDFHGSKFCHNAILYQQGRRCLGVPKPFQYCPLNFPYTDGVSGLPNWVKIVAPIGVALLIISASLIPIYLNSIIRAVRKSE